MNKIAPLLLGLLLAPAAIFASTPWTGTWAVTPESGGGTFTQQTIRQIVYTSVGGPAARIRLSNLFGSSPVTISDVHIALVSSGSSTQAGTDHMITFGGSGTVTIGANAEVYSDSIAMTIPSLSELAISFYLPNSTSVQTYHWIGQQTNYVANGDVSGNTSITVASTQTSYYYLTNLDVQSTALTGALVTFGASITDGYASTQNANHRWPNVLARRLSTAGINTVGVINQGLSANQLLIDASGTLSALHRFQHDAVLQPNVKWVIFSDDPLNDVGNNHSITGDQLITGVQQLISQAHTNGLKFLGSTLTPFHGAGGWSSTGETAREQYNAFIISPSSGCDGVVDQDAATRDPSNPTQFLPAYDSGDHLHPNDAGYQAIANCVNLSFFGSVGPATNGLTASSCNVAAMYTDGTTFGSGIDRVGNALSATLLGSSLNWNGLSYTFAAANTDNGVSNTTIALPAGQFSTLSLLGVAVNGNQTSQTFKVNYTNGTSSTFTQSLSDWEAGPQHYSGESTAFTMSYKNSSNGTQGTGPFYLYGYSFAINSSLTVSSLVLPANANVVIVAVDLSNTGGGGGTTMTEQCSTLAESNTAGLTYSPITGGPNGEVACKLYSTAVGQYLQFTVTGIVQGTSYDVTIGYRSDPTRGQCTLSVNGNAQPQLATLDEYQPAANWDQTADLGTFTAGAAGTTRTFTFTVSGKNSAATGYTMAPEWIALTPL
jgi:lysophospholipase L1-like esterase